MRISTNLVGRHVHDGTEVIEQPKMKVADRPLYEVVAVWDTPSERQPMVTLSPLDKFGKPRSGGLRNRLIGALIMP